MKSFLTIMFALLALGAGSGEPRRVEIEDVPSRVWAGERLPVTLNVTGVDKDEPVTVEWAWKYSQTDNVLQAGNRRLDREQRMKLEFKAPDVTNPVWLSLQVRLRVQKETRREVARSIRIFPGTARNVIESAKQDCRIGVVMVGDPAHPLSGIDGVAWTELRSPIAVRRFDGGLIFVQSARPFSRYSSMASALVKWVRQGRKLVCLGSHPLPFDLDRIPDETDPRKAVRGRILAPEHAVIGNLETYDFMPPKSGAFIAQSVLPVPAAGNYTCVLERSNGQTLQPLIMEMPVGKGSMVVSSYRIMPRIESDPVAAHLLANFIRWGATSPGTFHSARVICEEESGVGEALGEIGVEESESGRSRVVLTDGSWLTESRDERLKRMLSGNRTIVFFGLDADEVGVLNDGLHRWWDRRAGEKTPQFKLVEDAENVVVQKKEFRKNRSRLAAGARYEDLRKLGEGDGSDEMLAPVVPAESGDQFTVLAPGGWLAKYENDDVRMIFWQIPLKKKPDRTVRRVLISLLTNLGVKLSTE